MRYLLVDPKRTTLPPDFSDEIARNVQRFHRTLPGYKPTRLVQLRHLAESWGVDAIMVKDESTRFDLKAFKVLGSSYAVARLLGDKLGCSPEEIDFNKLANRDARQSADDLTFVTATDGNHGRGVAWTAEQLMQNAVIYMPKGTVASRVERIRSHGAVVEVTQLNYDDTVRLAGKAARDNGWELIQDSAWEGYAQVPTWIMQGYTTMSAETIHQMTADGVRPTHVFLQAGVGSLAAAVIGHLSHCYASDPPRFILMEPNNAACFLASAAAGDGRPRSIAGDLDTIMAGLACGEPNVMAWDILKHLCCGYISCDNYVAANGIRILANPLVEDAAVEAGESGSVGIGLLEQIANHPALVQLKADLCIGPDSRMLFFNTEGTTDPINSREILWHGKYPAPALSERG